MEKVDLLLFSIKTKNWEEKKARKSRLLDRMEYIMLPFFSFISCLLLAHWFDFFYNVFFLHSHFEIDELTLTLSLRMFQSLISKNVNQFFSSFAMFVHSCRLFMFNVAKVCLLYYMSCVSMMFCQKACWSTKRKKKQHQQHKRSNRNW